MDMGCALREQMPSISMAFQNLRVDIIPISQTLTSLKASAL